MDKDILEMFEITDLMKWLKKLDIEFKKSGEEYRKRISRLKDMLS